MFPPRRLNYWKSSFVYDLSDPAIETMMAQFTEVPSPFSQAALEQLGGAVSRIVTDETAFSERSAPYSLIIASAWTDPAENDKNIQWTRRFWEAMQPYESEAVYVNYLDSDEPDRIRAAYGETYERLVALKNTYDPTNLFRHNQNIQPTRWGNLRCGVMMRPGGALIPAPHRVREPTLPTVRGAPASNGGSAPAFGPFHRHVSADKKG
jgi:hypothetical protein